MNIVQAAQILAHKYHKGVTRKYANKETGIKPPYTTHTDGVAETVKLYGGNAIQQAAAHLHDVKEDVLTGSDGYDIIEDDLKTIIYADITDGRREEERFITIDIKDVISMVKDLTDVYTKEAYRNLNKDERNVLEANRLRDIKTDSKLVKMGDINYNAGDIVEHDPGYAPKYLKALEYKLNIMYTFTPHDEKPKLTDLYEYTYGVIAHQFNKLKFHGR